MKKLGNLTPDILSAAALVLTFTPPAFALLLVVAARSLGDQRVDVLMNEPSAVAGLPPWTGLVALLGSIGWATAFGAFLTGALVLRGEASPARPFLAASAALTMYLCLDDTFLLHEDFLPSIGVSEYVVFGFIGLATAAYVWRYWGRLRAGAFFYLVLALGLLGLSMGGDVIDQTLDLPLGYFAVTFIEDGSKLFGISAWVTFAVLTTRGVIRDQQMHHVIRAQSAAAPAPSTRHARV